MNRTAGFRVQVGLLVALIVASSPLAGRAQTTYAQNLVVSNNLTQGISTNTGTRSAALGDNTVSKGYTSFAVGYQTVASGNASHAEGSGTAATNTWAHAEGFATKAYGEASHAQGRETEAIAHQSHSGGRYSRVQAAHTNALIHATGTSGSYKQSQYKDTAHFDRLILFEAANSHSNSVLARWEADARYARLSYLAPQGDLGMGSYTNGP